MAAFSISEVRAMEILDSRGEPTIMTRISTEGGFSGSFSVPAGASRGRSEAFELRDGGKRLGGRGVLTAVANVEGPLAEVVRGRDVRRQWEIDEAMVRADGTKNKSRFGGNAILSVSMATARAAAAGLGEPLSRYLGGVGAREIPVPFMNVINGGVHAGNELAIQEFMIVPLRFNTFREALFAGVEVYRELKSLLIGKYGRSAKNLGDEGGFAPPIGRSEEALEILVGAIEEVGFSGKVKLALDAAASGFFDEEDGKYLVDGRSMSPGEMEDFYLDLVERYPIVSIEDPFHEEDFESFSSLTKKIGGRVQLVGDDFFTTNVERLKKGIKMRAGNALLLKINQIGTLSESLHCAEVALRAGYSVMVSHRSGETTDPAIADLAVGLRCGQIKAGAPARGERVSKYNRLLEIEEELGSEAVFAGESALGID